MKGSLKLIGKKRFTPEYKKEIIRLVTERRKKVNEVVRDIGVTPHFDKKVNPQSGKSRHRKRSQRV
jgi:transposase-like protein